MENVKLPVENACEPDEGARQPMQKATRQKCVKKQSTGIVKNKADDLENNVLSQPPKRFSHKQKLQWLQARRQPGLWAQCDDCTRWRHLPRVLDRHELPAKWFCWMNPDTSLASCSAAEAPISPHDEEDLIHAEYAAGSLVLARLPGFPWWPAMVADCPDTEQYYWLNGFSDVPTHYNVVFFDSFETTRAWISPDNLLPYKTQTNLLKKSLKTRKYKKRLEAATTQANDAENLPVSARLAKYSFIARFNGKIVTPKKITKNEKLKYLKAMKRKLNINIDFIDSSSDDEDTVEMKTVKPNKRRSKETSASITDAKINETTALNETLTDNTVKDSLAVQVDSDSALNKSIISEVIKEQESNKICASEEPTCLQSQDATTTDCTQNKDSGFDKIPEPDSIADTHEPTCFQTQETTTSIYIPEDTQNSDDFDF